MALRCVTFLLVGGILTACAPGGPTPITYRVGIVNPVEMRDPAIEAFQAGMADLGYITGENVTYLYNGPLADADERAAWVAELVAAEVDLIIGVTTPGAISAAQGADTIPVVFFPVTDPVGSSLVTSLREPGGNITGITNGNPHPLRLQLLLELDPSIETIYAPYNADSPPALSTIPDVLEIAEALGVAVIAPTVTTGEEVEALIDNVPETVDAIFAMPDPLVANYWQAWTAVSVEHGIPYSGLSQSEVEGGVLMAYGEDLNAVGTQAARMAHTILRGANPATLPVETADYYLSVNMDTAAQIGLTVPDALIQRASYIVYTVEGR